MPSTTVFKIFNDEVSTINRLYWLSRYSHEIAATTVTKLPTYTPKAIVSQLLPHSNGDVNRNARYAGSKFASHLSANEARLRLSTALWACSAYETLLRGLFSLIGIYHPTAVKQSTQTADLLMASKSGAAAAKATIKWAQTRAREDLSGTYGKRVELVLAAAASASGNKKSALLQDYRSLVTKTAKGIAPATLGGIDRHYMLRNKVAHAQGLSDQNAALTESVVVTRQRGYAVVSEIEWKDMLRDFKVSAKALDGILRKSGAIQDDGFHVGVIQVLLAHGGRISVPKMARTLRIEWGLSNVDHSYIKSLCVDLGSTVSTSKTGVDVAEWTTE